MTKQQRLAAMANSLRTLKRKTDGLQRTAEINRKETRDEMEQKVWLQVEIAINKAHNMIDLANAFCRSPELTYGGMNVQNR